MPKENAPAINGTDLGSGGGFKVKSRTEPIKTTRPVLSPSPRISSKDPIMNLPRKY
jgi:hypothetical protein